MGFKMKGFSPFTKVSGKEYRQMRRDKYEDYQDEAKEAKKEDRRERRSLRKSQRQEHGLLGARGERRSEKKALKARQLADRYDAKADYMSELKSDRKTIGGRRHLPWNWSSRPEDPAKQSFYGDGAKSASAFPKSESNYEGGVMKQTYGTVSPMKKNDPPKKKRKKSQGDWEGPAYEGADYSQSEIDAMTKQELINAGLLAPKKKVKIKRKKKRHPKSTGYSPQSKRTVGNEKWMGTRTPQSKKK
jgi:hypothetical protein